ncbi:hypothetical protein A7978_05765 (plasmid) [Borrelia turicatae]|uniref:Uncharacterized protein n=1 Tax=Borrelia turicatae TaxID=142 RepID=A0A172XCY9_BORTU|nr:Mlp family lipoprotein [Borrelia turicatae]ANF34545.1 hypothetical protein A7978_05765 [Borrelia turicatae]UPA15639.1 Mlp family lipoprotein [Borrelia turicatae]
MNKYIKLIILYHTILLYCCSEYKLNTRSKTSNLYNTQVPKKPTTAVQGNKNVDESDTAHKTDTPTIFSLTADEETKFNTFELALNAIMTIDQNILDYPKQELIYAKLYSRYGYPNAFTEEGYKRARERLAKTRVLYSEHGQVYKRIINTYTNLMKWIKDKPQQKQKLVKAFAPAYDFLETKRQEISPSQNINQYIRSAINWYGKSYWKKESDIFDVSRNGRYGQNSENCIYKFFESIMQASFSSSDTKESPNESLINQIVQEITSCGRAKINGNLIPILRAWGNDIDSLQCSN